MKLNLLILLFGALLSTSLLAQQVTNPPPAAPLAPDAAAPAAPATNEPALAAPAAAPTLTEATNAPAPKAEAKKPAPKKKTDSKNDKKKVAKKSPAKKPAGSDLKTVPLVAGPAVVIASNVNVRAQAKIKSEVVARITKGDAVTVIEEVVLKNSGADEPSAWAKIQLPASAHAWVNTAFIDGATKTVLPKKLNVRGGPGENYTVIGRLEHGEPVKEIITKGEWTEIQAPTNAFAFVAAQYLKQEAVPTVPTIAAAATTPEPPAAPATVTEPPAVATAPAEPPTAPATAVDTNTPAVVAAEPPTNGVPAVEEPLPPRVVSHEGFVRGTGSIQAPTKFALVSSQNGRLINYLFTTSSELDLRRYKGMRIVVSGEESLEERWGNTPVLTIQKIVVLE